jgi:predicted lysophospholipase L1 biosynthesis ABC-type transport system permease subunit
VTTNPVAQPRKIFLAALVLLALMSLVVLLATGHLVAAVAIGAVTLTVLVLAARPEGA